MPVLSERLRICLVLLLYLSIMGILKKLLRFTPFNKSYDDYLKRKTEKEQEQLEQKFHPLRVKFYSQFISKNDLVFDVGANVGNRVSSFLECGAKVIAVEPQPNCVAILKEKFGDKITVEAVGIGETQGELDMHIATDSTVSSFNQEYIDSTKERFKYTKWIDTIKVPIITMNDLIAKYGIPKFCKIDVEGFELEVLKGLHQVVPTLSLEYCVPEMHTQLIECVDRLHAITPQGKFNYSKGESMKWTHSNWMDYTVFSKHIHSDEFIKTSFGDIYFRSN